MCRTVGQVRCRSPPPARGPRCRCARLSSVVRITPACAGTTSRSPRRTGPGTDHPRLRGDHPSTRRPARSSVGSPPPARGPPHLAGRRRGDRRITPACAGTTRWTGGYRSPPADHPRLRGDHLRGRHDCLRLRGLPPPARGPRRPRPRAGHRRRITPACAGTTTSWCRGPPASADHPRLRGDHAAAAWRVGSGSGSPPPARGPQVGEVDDDSGERITPACAGTTGTGGFRRWRRTDHPRLRGDHAPSRR